MDKENIFTMASVQDEPVDQTTLSSLEDETIEEGKIRQLIRKLVKECYGWPVEKEEPVYGVKHPESKGGKDPKNSNLRLPKGLNSKDVG